MEKNEELTNLEFLKINIPGRVRDAILNTLRRAIITGQLQPGQRLTERQLSQTFNISTTPIKEALRILESEGLVQITSRRGGTVVSDFAAMKITEMFQIRAALEGVAAGFATQNATDRELQDIHQHWLGLKSLIDSASPDLIRQNTQFHGMIRNAAHNTYLLSMLNRVISYDLIFRQLNLGVDEERYLGWEEHGRVVAALVARDTVQAEKLLREHVIRSGHQIVDRLKQELQRKRPEGAPELGELLLNQEMELKELGLAAAIELLAAGDSQ